jgi:hypothetical protein
VHHNADHLRVTDGQGEALLHFEASPILKDPGPDREIGYRVPRE